MELSFAGKKLKIYKRKLKIRLYGIDFLVVLGMIVLFSIFKVLMLKNIIPIGNDLWSTIAVIAAFSLFTGILTTIVHFVVLKASNTTFMKFYMQLLADEAMLEGLTIFSAMDSLSDVDYKVLAACNGLQTLIIDKIITQTSSTAFFDLICLHYENNQFGVIIKTKTDKRFSDLVQIRNDGRRGIMEFDNKTVKQYGTGQAMNVKEFAIYSTMNTEIYSLFKEGSLEDLYEFSEFAKAPLVVTILEDNLFIFIDGWKFNLKRSLNNKDSLSIIDVQIEALKRLQSYIEKITLLINQAQHREEQNG